MYLTPEAVLAAITILRGSVHPFIGITFLACKRYGLAIGAMEELSLDALTRDHMDEFHRIDYRSQYYFQPFRGGQRSWVTKRYPSSGLQTVNTQTFSSVFLHRRDSAFWGFDADYLEIIQRILIETRNPAVFPADALAVWLYKDAELEGLDSYDQLIERFFVDYRISEQERKKLFSAEPSPELPVVELAFVAEPLEMTSVLADLPAPPDATEEGGRTITSLRLSDAGPARELAIDFGSRVSIVTGDNGLGKSFLLDFTWWAATGHWPDRQALPSIDTEAPEPVVEYALSSASGRVKSFRARFDEQEYRWIRPQNAMTIEALAVFSRADGSFAISDPARRALNGPFTDGGSLSTFEVWNGRPGLIDGLIQDWTRWQALDRRTFDLLASVLKRLSPEDLGTLTPGPSVRLRGDRRDIPTIEHRYGSTPVTHASSGLQRVLLLAYLMIWSWREHEFASAQLGRPPLRRMMVLVDELEAHLHPKWQRIVLPALIGASDLLSSELALQMVAATHSPMILASMEATFDPSTDVLYHLYGDGPAVRLEETPFVKYGDVSGWLTSPLFGLLHARSREAEQVIETAKALQLMENPGTDAVRNISASLKKLLASDDKFWPRWLWFAEQHGVDL